MKKKDKTIIESGKLVEKKKENKLQTYVYKSRIDRDLKLSKNK